MRHSTWNFVRTRKHGGMLAALGLQKSRAPIMHVLMPSLGLLAAGALVGAAAAVLLTPKSGPVFRRELADGARGLTRRLGDGASRSAPEANVATQS
jgi:hypothetical protein